MEQEPKKENPELKNYSNFLNLGDFDPEPIIKKCTESSEYKKDAVSALEDSILKEERPELFDDEYRKILHAIHVGMSELRRLNKTSEELMDDFIKENLDDTILINDLDYVNLVVFMEKATTFFDRRLSPTLLGLAEDDFKFLKNTLTNAREKITQITEQIERGEFYKLPKNQEKIQKFKERLDLIKDL